MQKLVLSKIVSGGQTGSDCAGLFVAKSFGLKTGGYMPKYFRTLSGFRPDLAKLYNLQEHSSQGYQERTWDNVFISDGTVRFFTKQYSPGERCTLNAINAHGRPHFDVDLNLEVNPGDLLKWLVDKHIKTLNVAGNSEQTSKGIYEKVVNYLTATFELGGLHK
jgi:hypothetical protein